MQQAEVAEAISANEQDSPAAGDGSNASADDSNGVSEQAGVEEPTDAEGELRSERTPIHRRWWFWTLLGAVVVGTGLGVGLGVGLNSGDPDVVLPSGSVGVLDGRDSR